VSRRPHVHRPPVRRLVALLALTLFAFGGVVVRLAVLQVHDVGRFQALGAEQRTRIIQLPATRGEILDRNGTPLAMSLEARDVYTDPTLVTDPRREAARIAPVLGLRNAQVRADLTGAGTFDYIARNVSQAAADRLSSLRLAGIGFLPSQRRTYPSRGLASQVVGFVGVDGEGLDGLEEQYDSFLAGTPGKRTIEVSAQGQQIAGGVDDSTSPRPGGDVVLTIDRSIQFEAQQALASAVRHNHAKGGTIVVMDPVTGDIYAMATYPWFDPNDYESFRPSTRRNRAVTDTWEPGSVNKVITAAAAIETHAVSLKQRLEVPWARRVEGYTIHDSHEHPVEWMTLGDIIAQSSNVGASLIADRVGNDAMAAAFARFGYGQITGVGFPGEAAGLVPPLEDWSHITRATASFGAGVSVTPLQMASVYATIANGGLNVQPRLVRATIGGDGTERTVDPSPTRRVIRPDTADILTRMLAYVVQNGTGINAQIPGYQVAGKTGTAKKLDATGHYTNKYVASFIGFLPAAQPRVVIAAIIDEPSTIYGGIAAAPLFQEVARFAIQRLAIEPAPPVKAPPHAFPSG
jgi:cell division protein FtsI (penicillin-binding protein 3)